MKDIQLIASKIADLLKGSVFLFITVVILTLSSCKKFVATEAPPTEITTATVFSDSVAAASAITGLYSQMMSSNIFLVNGGVTLVSALSSDELTRTSPNSFYDVFTANAIPSNNSLVQNNLWRAAYSYIYQCNAIIEGAGKSSSLSSAFKQRLTAEARFNRAFCYFYLVNLFGDVPLVTTTDYSINASMPRTPSSAVYAAIDADLQFATSYLPAIVTENIQPTSSAAAAVLARSKLFQKDWAAAEANATTVINVGLYSLPADLSTVFTPGSSETIWQLVPVQPSFNTAEANVFIPANGATRPTYVLTQALQNAFDTGDARPTIWIKTSLLNGQSYAFPYKYKERIRMAIGSPSVEYNVVLRLAEQYLIRAEARVKQGNLSGAKADLNIIRNRAGLPNVVAADDTSLLLAIEKERQREFFAEWGHRWLDLKRTGRADAVLSLTKSGWQPSDALYPIPFDEIQNNPAFTQNPGY